MTTEELHRLYREASDPVLRNHYHMLYLVAAGHEIPGQPPPEQNNSEQNSPK